MTYTMTRAWELLEKLGNSSAAVADRLRALGIKGSVRDPDSCPVALYLRGEQFEAVSVGSALCGFHDEGVIFGGRSSLTLPLAVSTFIEEFDHHHYKDMEARPE